MKITREDIVHVADLARLDLNEDAIKKFSDQIGMILEYVEKLNQVNTEGVSPTTHAILLTNAFREDEEHQHIDIEDALTNAPEKEDGQFIVPKIVK